MFLDFIWALTEDRRASVEAKKRNPSNPYDPDAGDWENITIETFFEAALAWAADSSLLPEEASWKSFAELLYLGKIYE